MLAFLSFGSLSHAANTTDTYWAWDFPWYSFERYTEAREKNDASPIYFSVESARLDGGEIEIKVVFDNYAAPSYQQVRYVKKPGRYCLSSNAYEDRGKGVRVRVRGDRQGMYNIKASGVWSPDSWSCAWGQ